MAKKRFTLTLTAEEAGEGLSYLLDLAEGDIDAMVGDDAVPLAAAATLRKLNELCKSALRQG